MQANLISVNPELIKKAYELGRQRGTSLSLGYYLSPQGSRIFCQNPNSSSGMMVSLEGIYYSDLPKSFVRFDMSEALEVHSL